MHLFSLLLTSMKKRLRSFLCTSKRPNSSDDEDDCEQYSRTSGQIRMHQDENSSDAIKRGKPSKFLRSRCQWVFQSEPRDTLDARDIDRHRDTLSEPIYESLFSSGTEAYSPISSLIYCEQQHTGNVTDGKSSCPVCEARTPPQLTWQYAWTRDEVVDALASSPFALLPDEISLRILQSLSVRDLANVSLICRQFKILTDDETIWQRHCQGKSSHSFSFLAPFRKISNSIEETPIEIVQGNLYGLDLREVFTQSPARTYRQ